MYKRYKQILEIKSYQTFKLSCSPFNHDFVVAEQNNELCLWYTWDSLREKEPATYEFIIVGTGHEYEITQDMKFIGTVSQLNGLVWHVYYQPIFKSTPTAGE